MFHRLRLVMIDEFYPVVRLVVNLNVVSCHLNALLGGTVLGDRHLTSYYKI